MVAEGGDGGQVQQELMCDQSLTWRGERRVGESTMKWPAVGVSVLRKKGGPDSSNVEVGNHGR